MNERCLWEYVAVPMDEGGPRHGVIVEVDPDPEDPDVTYKVRFTDRLRPPRWAWYGPGDLRDAGVR